MHPIRADIINALQSRISEYEILANSLVEGYLYTNTQIPENIATRYEAMGTIIDGLHEAISIIYSEGLDRAY